MTCSKLRLICFSPTRTTKRVLKAIAEGVDAKELTVSDVTRNDGVPDDFDCSKDDLVIIGAPVYSGRLPSVVLDRLATLKGNGVPVVLVVVYGNRAYEDALLELTDLAEGAGFKTVAGAAFIGEHSFSTSATPLSVGRPDFADIDKAKSFGAELASKFSSNGFASDSKLKVPGNKPYKTKSASASVSPISLDNCELCGSCERVCPTGAIAVGAHVVTDGDKCILCCACIKVCTAGFRKMEIPKILKVTQFLADTCKDRKEPEIHY
ncbi:4Fe-4S binding domain-containing protein [Maridesulfovibrio ferrireducens]|uniref:4Fe-4S binding domain-containing protein n=1 Tax=Maridesulfovibrio ferrireducens TaxID=246191 RepID=A0A1G9KA12_9BACT|nr:4Fe-4S binding protein [Maridesulfovibrio ferrireducens]SDL46406.1 4Fe-4S binding domain-containing protein [Maridesulfovibrio ferrireducens]